MKTPRHMQMDEFNIEAGTNSCQCLVQLRLRANNCFIHTEHILPYIQYD